MQFIIIHGSFGSPEGNWFPELKKNLNQLGQKVVVPQFPVDDYDFLLKEGRSIKKPHQQTLNNWLDTFSTTLSELDLQKEIVIVSHSIGPVFALHAVEKFKLSLDCAIFVSPFMRSEELSDTLWPYDLVNKEFYSTNFDFDKLKQQIPLSYVLYSDTDPYIDKKYPLEFAEKLNSSVIPIIKAGHLNSEVGLTKFPLVLELCKSRLEPTVYLK